MDFEKVVQLRQFSRKFIAHCLPEQKQSLPHYSPLSNEYSSLILIGPEGDFTTNEIKLAIKNHFQPVALGETRLRTETAGMVAATLLCIR
jgi:16S rRNA (uracil1498-N3)-methyltransferase